MGYLCHFWQDTKQSWSSISKLVKTHQCVLTDDIKTMEKERNSKLILNFRKLQFCRFYINWGKPIHGTAKTK